MSKDSPPPAISSTHRRRASVMLPLQTIFPPGSAPSIGPPPSATTPTGSVTAAASQDLERQRRLSMNTIGLAALGQQAPSAMWARRASVSSSFGSDESALDESADWQLPSPLSRRLSTGANAFRQSRSNMAASPNDGFNFADNFRSRAERASMSGASRPNMPSTSTTPFSLHRRALTMSSTVVKTDMAAPSGPAPLPPAPAPTPVRPAAPVSRGLTDPIQERILKGDFYMD